MIIDSISNSSLYFKSHAWNIAFNFLNSLNAESKEGKHNLLNEDIYAGISVYNPKKPEEGRFEAHRKYVDVQALLSGYERIEVSPINNLRLNLPYDDAKDVEFFTRDSSGIVSLDMSPGMFAVFFPEDAHQPGIKINSSSELIKKVVIKIKFDLLK